MGFLQDIGNFMSEVNSLGEELDTMKRDVIQTLVDSSDDIKQTVSDTASDLSNSASQISDTVKRSTTLPSNPLDDSSSDD